MVYRVIGLMSGSSLDGLDIAYVHLTETRGNWSFELQAAECIPYDAAWRSTLKNAPQLSGLELARLHSSYGRFLGSTVQDFISRHQIAHGLHFIASHGHTVFHEPQQGMTLQIGNGAAIAAATQLPVISDLRLMDVAFGGQGAPIVPAGDSLLFGTYDAWLNLGGIANITLKEESGALMAFDICPCNQVLDALAAHEHLPFDDGGRLAAGGALLPGVFEVLEALPYYQEQPPKSLANTFSAELLYLLHQSGGPVSYQLYTAVAHIASQVARVVQPVLKNNSRILATGGGALNSFLISEINEHLALQEIQCVSPSLEIVHFKEAIVMALIGALRWREEANVFASVTGAAKDTINGALWLPG